MGAAAAAASGIVFINFSWQIIACNKSPIDIYIHGFSPTAEFVFAL